MNRFLLAACLAALAAAPLSAEEDETEEETAADGSGGSSASEPAAGGASLGGAGVSHDRPAAGGTSWKSGFSGGGGGGATAKAGGGAGLPAELRSLRWRVYERLALVPREPHYTASHGYGNMASGEGISVGFKSGAAGKNGRCVISASPATSGPPGCRWNAWISDKPGGSPLKEACGTFGIGSDMASAEWASSPHPYGKHFCDLKPSTRYYCNVAGCRGLIGSPLGVDDYTIAEALSLNTGKSCNMPGSVAIGAFDAQGVCRCQDERCETILRVAPTLPRCTNQVRRMNGTCYSCASAYPSACGGGNVVVEDCQLSCR